MIHLKSKGVMLATYGVFFGVLVQEANSVEALSERE